MIVGGIVLIIAGLLFVGAAIWMWVAPDEWTARLQGFPIPVWLGGILSMLIGLGIAGGGIAMLAS